MRIFLVPHLPLGRRFMAINLFGLVLSRYELNATETNHEYIHSLQQRELLWIFFYLFYGLEWLAKLFLYRSPQKAYLNLSFEREAYARQSDLLYHESRRWYSWLSYLYKTNN